MAKALSRALDLPRIELDAINWQPGWRDISIQDPDEFYRRVAEDLRRELDVRPQDVFINLVEVKKENWSFGNGIVQYAS